MPVATHIADQNNPHQVDKNDVVLGNVENYLVASQVEAETGTATDRYMTPLRVRQNINKVLFDEGFVDGNGDPIIDQSFDWTLRLSQIQAGSVITGVARANNVYLAVGINQGDSNYQRSWTSPDGINWTNRPIGDVFIQSVASNGGLFVIFANGGNDGQTTDRRIYTSTDGISWIQRTNPASSSTYTLGKIRYLNNRFLGVATNATGTKVLLHSTDGINWTLIDTLQSDYPVDFSYGNGVYVIVTTTNKVLTSTDLVTFTNRPLTNTDYQAITFDGTKFVMVGSYFATSTDGITWNEVFNTITGPLRDIAYSFGRYVAVAYTPTANTAKIVSSTDGVNWVLEDNPLNGDYGFYSVFGFGNTFLATAGGGPSQGGALISSI